MTSNIKNPSLRMRTDYFCDALKAQTGLSAKKIWTQINDRQYLHYEMNGPAWGTVHDYFRSREPLFVDFRQAGKSTSNEVLDNPGWLMAAEMEFPGSSYAFFHPIFDLLFGTIYSQFKWELRFSRMPEKWIEEEERKGNIELAAEWRERNAQLSKPGRRKDKKDFHRLDYIHNTLIRLPDQIFQALFCYEGSMVARTYAEINSTLELLAKDRSLEGLAAIFGLVRECQEIGNHTAYRAAKNILEVQLIILGERIEYKRIATILRDYLLKESRQDARCYSRYYSWSYGLPASWRATLESPTRLRG